MQSPILWKAVEKCTGKFLSFLPKLSMFQVYWQQAWLPAGGAGNQGMTESIRRIRPSCLGLWVGCKPRPDAEEACAL